MTGEWRVQDACRELGLKPSRFFALRNQWLAGSLEQLEPKPAGRRAKAADEDPQVLASKRESDELRQRLAAAELRCAVAAAADQPTVEPTTKKKSRAHPRRRKAHRSHRSTPSR